MAVPRNRTSNARKNSRRSHHAKKPVQLSACSNCGARIQSHRICPACGYYRQKQFAQPS
ncbi:MAG: 50S ribosomal protein L32 [Chlamydiota bacterium]